MVRLTARFDGKVLVPDHPVQLPEGVPLDVTVQTADAQVSPDSILSLDGLGAEVWQGVDPLDFQRRERDGWE